MQCRYNAVNFLPNSHKIQPIDRPLGRDIGCNLWFDTLIYISIQSTQCCLKYRVILDRVITALDCSVLVGDYKYLKNGRFTFDVDPYQYNLRLHHFSQFLYNVKKMIFKSGQVRDWLTKWLIMLGFMDLRQPRAFRFSNVGLVKLYEPLCINTLNSKC